MRLVAHRGFASTAPENTLSALESAAESGADAVEFDVRRCGSSELVVVHDETLDRTTDGTGPVAETPFEDLRARTVLGTTERIPTFREALEAVPSSLEIHVELKETGVAADALATVAETVDRDRHGRVLLTSFLPSEIRTVRDRDPDQPVGVLASRRLEAPVTRAVELGCDVIGGNVPRCLPTSFVARARAVDLEVLAWTIGRRTTAKLLEKRGVDWMCADRPIRL
ncbi:glycerophosphodiester phosphodiesterase [Natrialbaceae archaeon GCM10025810]|uniref:glycerophosphodiester phosphodiesterase n=1 Tax=Halovalidus salilacus TaxID=3075124 RepID=UPI003622C7C7